MEIEIDTADVVRCILQFCSENNLPQTLKEEARISLNAVSVLDDLVSNVVKGRWTAVLSVCSTLELPIGLLEDIYEEIFLDLIEKDDKKTCLQLLERSLPLLAMRSGEPSQQIRYKRLLYLASAPVESLELRKGYTREQARQRIAQSFKDNVQEVYPARLVSLLRSGISWEMEHGKTGIPTSEFGLFTKKE